MLEKAALDALTRERIALAIAELNGSEYCLSAQNFWVRQGQMLDDAEIAANCSGASNDIKADAAVRFAAKLAHSCETITDTDVTATKAAVYSDAEIVEIIAHVAVSLHRHH